MNLPLSIAVPMLIAAEAFTLVVTHKNGETTTIPTEDITDIRFEESTVTPVEPTILTTPTISVQGSNYSDFLVHWDYVANAAQYEWTLDNETPVKVNANQTSFTNISEGSHTIAVRALPGSDDYAASDYARAEFESKFRLQINCTADGENTVKATFRSNSAKDYIVAIVPESIGRDEATRVTYINDNATATQRQTVAAAAESTVTFTGLEAGTSYYVVGFRTDLDYSFGAYISTGISYQPGAKGSVFPNGVSENGGFVDVDKVTTPSDYGLDDSDDQVGAGGGDSQMCWACTAAGMCQWWLDEYKRVTGNDYPLTATLPSHGVYSTDIMEAMVKAYPNTGGDAMKAIKWFFAGVARNEVINEVATYNENYANWKGGFGGLTSDEILSYLIVSEEASDGYPEGSWPYVFNRLYSLKGLTLDQAKKKFSKILIETLREGPAAVVIAGSHSVAFWGCDYTVDADGDPIVTAVYVGENDNVNGNVKGGLNKGTVTFKSYNEIWFSLASVYDGGSVNTTRINSFFGLKGYKK